MPGMPAARVGDMHVCPMVNGLVPHAGGPIVGPGVPNVLIGGMPAACMGDTATCVGPIDSIVKGSTGVMIMGRPAARVGDMCAHGGTIAVGCPTVLIGETSPDMAPPVKPPLGGTTAAATAPASATQATTEAPEQKSAPQKTGLEPEKPLFTAEYRLVGEDGEGIALERYRVTLPDGTVREGVTDLDGKIRIEGLESQGPCKVSFPELDQDCWEET